MGATPLTLVGMHGLVSWGFGRAPEGVANSGEVGETSTPPLPPRRPGQGGRSLPLAEWGARRARQHDRGRICTGQDATLHLFLFISRRHFLRKGLELSGDSSAVRARRLMKDEACGGLLGHSSP